MASVKRLYRAIAYYQPDDVYAHDYKVTRHFQTKRARDRWVAARLEGYDEAVGGYSHINGFDEPLPAIPPAYKVVTDDSEPIVFLADTLMGSPKPERCFETPGTHAEGCKP